MRGKAAPHGLMATPEGRQLKESQAGRITYTLESSLDSVNRVEQMAEELAKKARIADQGVGLDPATLPDPLAPENLLRGSGRGIFLIRSFMDEVHFKLLNPGTELTLVKHLGAAQSGQ